MRAVSPPAWGRDRGALTVTRPPPQPHLSSDRCVLGSPGFLADGVTLQKRLQAAQVMYEHDHGRQMSCPAMAQVRRAGFGWGCPAAQGRV